MNDPKGNKQPQVVALRMDIFRNLDREYSQSRPRLPSFTAYVNWTLERHIKRDMILAMLYPNLKIIASDPETGIYVRDAEEDRIVEVSVDKNALFQSVCKYHKNSTCDHVKFALLSSWMVDVYDDAMISGSSGESASGDDETDARARRYRLTRTYL